MARDWAKKYDDFIFLCGRYEGIDARAAKILRAEKISVGPFVLTGGELPAMIVIDAVARQIPGVLGTFESVEEKRIASPDVYTRPEVLIWKKKNHRVPKVLLSGNHAKIEKWKSEQRTRMQSEKSTILPVASARSAHKGSLRTTQKITEEWKSKKLKQKNETN
jgi:tRNA (guanine37-N1)-methyltransferase